ncbi:hypothetical protein LXL04_033978 [Taraxacum kok-saghyz]
MSSADGQSVGENASLLTLEDHLKYLYPYICPNITSPPETLDSEGTFSTFKTFTLPSSINADHLSKICHIKIPKKTKLPLDLKMQDPYLSENFEALRKKDLRILLSNRKKGLDFHIECQTDWFVTSIGVQEQTKTNPSEGVQGSVGWERMYGVLVCVIEKGGVKGSVGWETNPINVNSGNIRVCSGPDFLPINPITFKTISHTFSLGRKSVKTGTAGTALNSKRSGRYESRNTANEQRNYRPLRSRTEMAVISKPELQTTNRRMFWNRHT